MKKIIKPIPITLDNQSATPVYEQVKQAIKWSILSGFLEDGDQLPSLRDLSLRLKINPNTIVKVYFQLEVEGFIRSQAGAGFFVKKQQIEIDPQAQRLFEQLSEEYLAKVASLGFSVNDIFHFMQTKNPAGQHPKKKLNKEI